MSLVSPHQQLLEAVPRTWTLRPLFSVVTVTSGATPSKDNPEFWSGSIPWVSPKDMKVPVIAETEDHVSDAALIGSPLKLVDPPAVLLVIRGMILAHTVPVAVTATRVTLNQDMKALRPRAGVHARFLAYQLRALGPVLLSMVEEAGHGTRCLRTDLWRKLMLAIPTEAEQVVIADFLDSKTAAIDAIIEKKESFALTLAEKRQALIRHVVTKGLDASVRLKDSGVASLGEIPSHWEVVTLRRVTGVGQGDAFAHDLQGQESGELPWFKVADMNRPGNEVQMISADNYVDRRTATEAKVTIFPSGAVVFPRVGAALLTNKRRILTRPSIIDDNTYAIVPDERIRSRFLYLSLLLVDMACISSAGLVPTVTFGGVKDLAIALPPLAEQDCIVRRIESECAALDALITSTNRSVVCLREYRRAVITAAVTGQLDIAAQEAA